MRLPSGEITLLFTDIEGSTRLWEERPETMGLALARHNELLRSAIEDSSGYVFKTVGDAFCASFDSAANGLQAALQAQRALTAETWPESLLLRVRIGLHSGRCDEHDGDYVGPTVNRAARLVAVAHGGQTVVSGSTAELVLSSMPNGVTLLDLGEHRLKDLGRPERIFQLEASGLARAFPPLRSLDNPELGNNLPQQLTSFVGRETEMAEIRELLETSRLVTLTGAGGVGKSRLAVQLAADLLDGSGNGVWLVELAPLSDPGLVPRALASILSVRDEPGQAVLDTLLDALRDRQLLVVLDNCEHLIGACAKMADAVLRSCPNIDILATSREPLGIDGEQIYRVPSLSLPSGEPETVEGIQDSEAVQLFVARAGARDPTFLLVEENTAAVASICRRLDGIPLAIELAASRIGSLSAPEIETRLDNRFRLLTTGSRTADARQQTLRAMVDWSYDLLVEPERVLLSRLSVFAGGFTLKSAESVCVGGHVEEAVVIDLLGFLVDKSLIQADTSSSPPRYRLLETIREYAAEKLTQDSADDIDSVRSRHAHYFLMLAEEAAPRLRTAEQGTWVANLEQEHDNLRQAFDQFSRDGAWKDALHLVVALDLFWRIRGYFTEGIDALHEASSNASQAESRLVSRALVAEGALRVRRGDHGAARPVLESALAMAQELGQDVVAADALGELAYLRSRLREYAVALKLANEAVAIARRSGDAQALSVNLDVRASILGKDDPAAARRDWSEALELRAPGRRRTVDGSGPEQPRGPRHEGSRSRRRSFPPQRRSGHRKGSAKR